MRRFDASISTRAALVLPTAREAAAEISLPCLVSHLARVSFSCSPHFLTHEITWCTHSLLYVFSNNPWWKIKNFKKYRALIKKGMVVRYFAWAWLKPKLWGCELQMHRQVQQKLRANRNSLTMTLYRHFWGPSNAHVPLQNAILNNIPTQLDHLKSRKG